MKAFIKQYQSTLLFFLCAGAVGGYLTGLYLLGSYPPQVQLQLMSQGIGAGMLALITAVQSALYGLIFGIFGIYLGKKTGLWKDERSLTKKPLIITAIIAVIGGLALILPDLLFFGRYSVPIANSFSAKPTLTYILASVIYGGIIEEVMLRLFMMSLIAFILYKLFDRKSESPALWILVVANIISALLFAAGHLPTTFVLLGSSPIIIFRCFLLNGVFGLLFGWLYRKYGLRYAMLAHGGCHIVSKAIWILFL